MKFCANLTKCKEGVLLFEINGYTPALEIDQKYSVEVKPYKSNRSIEQNNFMWAIIQRIALVTGNAKEDIYISGLAKSGAKPIFMAGLPETEKDLKRNFKVVKPVGTFLSPKGVKLITYEVYEGSSQYDTKEMTVLVDYFIKLAAEHGIQIESEE